VFTDDVDGALREERMTKHPVLDANYTPGTRWWGKKQDLAVAICVAMYLSFYATIVFLPPQEGAAPDAGVANNADAGNQKEKR
jgi:hypothetical protein